MRDLFYDFLDILFQDDRETALTAAMDHAANALDLRWFAYLAMPDAGFRHPQLISNYPTGWTARYLASHYERIDPVIRQAINHSQSFMWGPEFAPLETSRPEQRFFDEAAQFGVKYGLTIPVHDRTRSFAAITFATNEPRGAFRQIVCHNGETLRLLAHIFHAYAHRRFAATRSSADTLNLSSRQLECLKWAARGKSAWEIGKIIGVSQRTAAFHLDKAKEKLGVRTISQAVARLVAANTLQH